MALKLRKIGDFVEKYAKNAQFYAFFVCAKRRKSRVGFTNYR